MLDSKLPDLSEPPEDAREAQLFLAACGLQANLSDGDNGPAPHAAPATPRDSATAWASLPQWHVLASRFGLGQAFLATWAAWRADPKRPSRLFFTAIDAQPVTAEALRRSAHAHPELCETLLAQWHTLLPGLHRLVFEGGAVQLTLCVGDARAMLRELDVPADSVYLSTQSTSAQPSDTANAPADAAPGTSDDTNDDASELHLVKALARLARRGTRLACAANTPALRQHLQQCGFVLASDDTHIPSQSHPEVCLAAEYAPRWTPRHLTQLRQPLAVSSQADRHAVVVGAGISGASVAASLAARGWRVTVLDAAPMPASGASGLPAGIFAPHVSPDDGRLAQLTRTGLRAMRGRCEALLTRDEDWAPTGVLELPVGRERRLPAEWLASALPASPTPTGHASQGSDEAQPNAASEMGMACLSPEYGRLPAHTATPPQHPGLDSSRHAQASDVRMWQADVARQRSALASEPLWHAQAGWVRPAQLVRALLSQPGVRWRGGCHVARADAVAVPAASQDAYTGESQLAAGHATSSADQAGSVSHGKPTEGLSSSGHRWQVFNDAGVLLESCDLIVLASGPATASLLNRWATPEHFPTHQVHGLVTVGAMADWPNSAAAPSDATGTQAKGSTPPVNGHGSLLRDIPGPQGGFWCTGASFLRALPRGFDAATIAAEHQANAQRLAELLPVTASAVRQQIRAGQVTHWNGTRCTVADRVPLVGPLAGLQDLYGEPGDAGAKAAASAGAQAKAGEHPSPAPWVCTAMGARGMTLAVLCGELLAAWVHGEPLPMTTSLAAKLQADRFMPR